ncbi:MAG: type I secretion system permease/ATPase [Proteobacteria bacterium]|nr:type I secretion system permease/ATPase [Pseudomonadota bacterium]MBU1387596.1 type I secretion system permease/ATPase [Pseudomonadota bacterium]MBU1544187.1 type I secretion system permease/ATPase [Pseudomonadota bacterium]MBU2430390.1 type I secretion system permease/ATPase [Pseudomonadota bacterium]
MQTGLSCLDIIAKINKVDFDIRGIIREYGIGETEIASEDLIRIAKAKKFKVKKTQINVFDLYEKYPLPAIFVSNDGNYGVLLNVKISEKQVLIFRPGAKNSETLTAEEFEKDITGEFFIFRHKESYSNSKFGFKWFYLEILKYKRIVGEILLGSFVVQLFGLITPLFTQVILDKVIVHHSLTTLDILAVAFIAVAIFEILLNISRKYIFVHTASKIDARLGAKLFKHLLSLPFVYFEHRQVGNIAARVRELDTIRDFITNKSITVIIDLLFSVVFVVMMALYSVKLVLIVCTIVSLIALLYLIVTPELRRRLEEKFQMGAQSNSFLVETITGIHTVKSMAIEGATQKKWDGFLAQYVHSSFKLLNLSNISGAIAGFLQKIMTILVLYIGVKLVIENKLSIGQLIAFQMFAGQFIGPVLRLVNLWNEFQQALLSVDRLGDILNHPVELQSSSSITLQKLKGTVRFDNVFFKYSPDAPYVLNKINFDIKEGMKVGIVGRSGSGKSTVTKLIQRLYLANEGGIYFDNIDIRHMNPYWLRNNIGVVIQESYLFSGTIKENIIMPKPDAGIDLVINMAQISGAHEFVSQLPDGYDTLVGERGGSLSGGQKQRIAIARALITNPKILIFDEATSALDYESEMIIRKNLNLMSKGRTVFIISHKLSIVKDCDVIIAMDHGEIVEMGNHKSLMDKKGYYQYLNSLQGL